MYNPPYFSSSFVLVSTDEEPKSVREEIDSTEGKLCKDFMVKEMESLDKNEKWDLVKLPNRRKPIGRKWVFKKKLNAIGQVEKFKSQLEEK